MGCVVQVKDNLKASSPIYLTIGQESYLLAYKHAGYIVATFSYSLIMIIEL